MHTARTGNCRATYWDCTCERKNAATDLLVTRTQTADRGPAQIDQQSTVNEATVSTREQVYCKLASEAGQQQTQGTRVLITKLHLWTLQKQGTTSKTPTLEGLEPSLP